MLKRLLNAATHRLYEIPVLVLMPHSRCNCRCVMCDIWKANQEKREISVEVLEMHITAFRKLGVRRVALSGGEALMHSNLWKFCDVLHSIGAKISLLSTGLTLKHHAHEIVRHCDDVVVSLDGDREIHDAIRNIPGAFDKLEEGVDFLKKLSPRLRITGRTVLQKKNFRNFPSIVYAARDMGLDQISFLGADVSPEAFNRSSPWETARVSEVALNLAETNSFETLIKQSFIDLKNEYDTKFIAEAPEKMMAIVQYYQAIHGKSDFPLKKCNAPWVSAVVESTGDVLPCFFHKPYGNIHDNKFEAIINSEDAIRFRQNLDMKENPTCRRCVCSLYLGAMQSV